MSPVSRRETALCPPFGGSLRQGASARPRPPSCGVFAGRERGPPMLVPRGAEPGARESGGRPSPCSNGSDSPDRVSKPTRACPQALAGVRIVREARLLVAEVGAAEPRSEKRPGAVVEREIPDLVRVLVLDNRPGVRAAVGRRRQQPLVEDDEAGARARAPTVGDPNRHRGRNEVPVERARLERCSYLRPRRLAPARENVGAAAGLSLRGDEERRKRNQQDYVTTGRKHRDPPSNAPTRFIGAQETADLPRK